MARVGFGWDECESIRIALRPHGQSNLTRPGVAVSCGYGVSARGMSAEEGERDRKLVFNNPWVGKGSMADRSKTPLPPAVLLVQAKCDFDTFAATGRSENLEGGGCSLKSPSMVDVISRLSVEEQATVTSVSPLMAEWDEDLDSAVQHVGAVRALLVAGASPDLVVGPLWETPLMIAAQRGNAAVTAVLLGGGADTELMRWVGGWVGAHAHLRVRGADTAAGWARG